MTTPNEAADRLRDEKGIGYTRESWDALVDAALVTERQRTVEPGIEALRHLFFVMERLDKQAGPPYSDDHMVKVTAETWIDLVRPAVQQVRRILDSIATDENGGTP